MLSQQVRSVKDEAGEAVDARGPNSQTYAWLQGRGRLVHPHPPAVPDALILSLPSVPIPF